MPPNEMTLKKLKTPIKHINTFLISFLTFMTIRSQNRKLKSNSRAIRALGLLKGIAKSSKKKQRKILKNRETPEMKRHKTYKNLFQTIKKIKDKNLLRKTAEV